MPNIPKHSLQLITSVLLAGQVARAQPEGTTRQGPTPEPIDRLTNENMEGCMADLIAGGADVKRHVTDGATVTTYVYTRSHGINCGTTVNDHWQVAYFSVEALDGTWFEVDAEHRSGYKTPIRPNADPLIDGHNQAVNNDRLTAGFPAADRKSDYFVTYNFGGHKEFIWRESSKGWASISADLLATVDKTVFDKLNEAALVARRFLPNPVP